MTVNKGSQPPTFLHLVVDMTKIYYPNPACLFGVVNDLFGVVKK